MFLSLVRSKVTPDKEEEFIRIFEEGERRLTAHQKGFRGSYLTEPKDGEILLVSLWDSKEVGYEWVNTPECQEAISRLTALTSGPASIEEVEVRVAVIP